MTIAELPNCMALLLVIDYLMKHIHFVLNQIEKIKAILDYFILYKSF